MTMNDFIYNTNYIFSNNSSDTTYYSMHTQDVPSMPKKECGDIDQDSWEHILQGSLFLIDNLNKQLLKENNLYVEYLNKYHIDDGSPLVPAKIYCDSIDLQYFHDSQISNLFINWLESISDDHGIFNKFLNENGTLNIKKFLDTLKENYRKNPLNIKIDSVPTIKEKSKSSLLDDN